MLGAECVSALEAIRREALVVGAVAVATDLEVGVLAKPLEGFNNPVPSVAGFTVGHG